MLHSITILFTTLVGSNPTQVSDYILRIRLPKVCFFFNIDTFTHFIRVVASVFVGLLLAKTYPSVPSNYGVVSSFVRVVTSLLPIICSRGKQEL